MQLRINLTCIFKVSKLPLLLRDSVNLVKTKIHAITYTNQFENAKAGGSLKIEINSHESFTAIFNLTILSVISRK